MNAQQYNRLNELLSEFSTLDAAFELAEAEIKTLQLAAAKELLPRHAELKIKMADMEAQLHKLADAHYAALFLADERRTHNTPFGGLKYLRSTNLEVADEEKSILKIKVLATEELARESSIPNYRPKFTAAQFIRTREELDLEALAKCDDATLATFGLKRVHKDNFAVVPFKMQSDRPAKKPALQEAA